VALEVSCPEGGDLCALAERTWVMVKKGMPLRGGGPWHEGGS
jgi:hypothetical protein